MAQYVLKIKETKLADIVFHNFATNPDGPGGAGVSPADNLVQIMTHLNLADSLIDCNNIVYSLLNLLISTGVDLYKQALRVDKITGRFAEYLSLTATEREYLHCASLLHDLGMLGISPELRAKPEPLSPGERRLLVAHPALTYRILDVLDFCGAIKPLVRYHHERIDGTGYPEGLREGDIPLASRIIAIADAFDAMTVQRPYRREVTTQLALEELYAGGGTQFDGRLVGEFSGFVYSRFWLNKGLRAE